MEKLNKYILHQALLAGICKPGALEIASKESKEELLEMYVKGIDFCLANNFPSNNDLVTLGGGLLQKYGVYVDANVALKNPEFSVLLGSTKMDLHINDYNTSQVFVKHSSQAEIDVSGHAFVVLDCFDEAIVKARAYGNSKVVINIYGKAKVSKESTGNAYIKVIHKNKSTY